MIPPPEVLSTALARLAPEGVAIGVRRISEADASELHEVEAAHVERAVPKRRNEYASGRRLLRDLLRSDETIPTADDRKPMLPDGAVGSLAHDDHFVVAAVAKADDFGALGVDVEPATPLAGSLATAIVRPDEHLDAHLAFTLKEAVYKAWSTGGGPMLEHHDVRLEVNEGDPDGRPVPYRGEVVASGTVLNGHFTRAGGRWLALVTVPEGRVQSAAHG